MPASRLRHRMLAGAAAACLALLAGCGDQPIGTFDRAEFVQRDAARAVHDLAFLPASTELAPEEIERFAAYLGGLARTGVDEVLLTMVPSGSPDLDRRRAGETVGLLRQAGFAAPVYLVDSRDFARADERSNIVLVEALGRGQLLVACPRRHAGPWEEANAGPLPHLGCANAANLAYMAARPRDLVAARTLGPADGAVAGAALLRYRTGQVTPPPPLATSR